MDPLFPALPENVEEMTDEELDSYLAETKRIAQAVADGDAEVIGERTDVEVDDELERAEADAKRAQDERDARDQDAAKRAERIAARTAAIVGEPEPEEEPDAEGEDNPEDESEPEPQADAEAQAEAERQVEEEQALAAAAARRSYPPRRMVVAPPRRAPENDPQPGEKEQVTATLLGESRSFNRGDRLRTPGEIGLALYERLETFGPGDGSSTGAENIRVARIEAAFTNQDVVLTADGSPFENYEKVQEKALDLRRTDVEKFTELVASGGLCAPVTPYYELQDIGDASRPVRDSVPTFNAERGGITFAAPPTLSGVSTAVGVRTVAQDAAGTPTKTVQTIPCPSFSTIYVNAIFASIKSGVFGARTFPEQVTQFQSLVRQAWARLADGTMLDQMANQATYSQPIPGATGAVVLTLGMEDFLVVLGLAGTGIRSRHRMNPDAVLQLQLPWWVKMAWEMELDRGNFFTENTLDQELMEYNISPNYYWDGASVGSPAQIIGAQSTGAINQLPAYADCYLYPAGSLIELDNGTLDIGVVRDSTLVASNDFQIFSESFEALAFIGQELMRLRIGINPAGSKSLAIAVPNPALTAHA